MTSIDLEVMEKEFDPIEEEVHQHEIDDELQALIDAVPTINYEAEDALAMQRAGALAVTEIANEFDREGRIENKQLIATVLVRLRDLQVRDFALGITNDENIEALCGLWKYLLTYAPTGLVAPVATLLSVNCYENDDTEMAMAALNRAFEDDPEYGLAKLLRRTYSAGWPSDSFQRMREELHPKVCHKLFGEVF